MKNYRVIFERDGIFRAIDDLDSPFPQTTLKRGESAVCVSARDRNEALGKAGKLWRLEPQQEEPMAKKKKKPKKKKKVVRTYGY